MSSNYDQNGFTLIELVIVIVILGILAAIAIPKFTTLQREARVAVIDSAYLSLKSGSNIVFAKAATNGQHTTTAQPVDLGDGSSVITNYGYPRAEAAQLALLFDDLSARFNFFGGGTGDAQTVQMRLDGIGDCRIDYTSPGGPGQRPAITKITTDC
jgi:MSHA pilin protein MshA